MPEDTGPVTTAGAGGADAGADKKPEEEGTFSFSWGILMVRTRKLLKILDDLARFRIFSDLGWVFIGITMVAAAIMIWLMLDEDYIILTGSLTFRCAVGAATASQCHAIGTNVTAAPSLQSYLLLPGLNPFIPIVYGLIGIIVAVVIHEGTHGVIARRLKLAVKSTGLVFLLIVPIGAFVEIDEKEIQKTRFRDTGRVMAGGPGSNIIVALVALGLLLLLVGGLVPAQFNGVQVQQIVTATATQPSPAYQLFQEHHLEAGDIIVAINGTAIDNLDNLTNYLNNTRAGEMVILSIEQAGHVNNYSIVLAPYPQSVENTTKGFIGISEPFDSGSLKSVKDTYASSFFKDPILYLVVPGIIPEANSLVPFSNQLAGLYSSPQLGAAWIPISLTLFWIWFININLAFFNAIPLYPLDGGQALLNFFSHFGRKGVELRARKLTTIVSVLMLILILSFLFLPRILGAFPV